MLLFNGPKENALSLNSLYSPSPNAKYDKYHTNNRVFLQ